MEFPAYVPAAVRAHITSLLNGDDWEPRGWAVALADAEDSLAEIELEIKTRTRRGELENLDSLRKQKAKEVKFRDLLAGYVDCLHRLAHDPRMKDPYESLTEEFTQDEQWRGFIHAAWSADIDYLHYRERLKRVTELRDKIAEASETLETLLRDTADVGFNFWPSEFYSIPELLRQTDNHKMRNHNLHMWRSMRKYVLGDTPSGEVQHRQRTQEESESESSPELVFCAIKPDEKPEIDPEEEARNGLRYAWGTAPDLSDLLGTLAKAARDFKPSESGVIGTAIQSRQRSKAGNKDYLRAFGNLLTEDHGIALTKSVMKAMAVVATVVLNDRDFNVDYDDVVKAIGKPVETQA